VARFITSDFVSLAYTIGFLIVVAGILFTLYRILIQAISAVMLWMLFGLTLVASYYYRFDLQDLGRWVLAEANPTQTTSHGTTVEVVRTSEGKLSINAEINGAAVTMAFDGHARLVVLTQNDAKAAGLPTELLGYTVDVETASGRARAAPVTLARMAIGGVVEHSVDALVAQPGRLKSSILGMSFLDRLQHWEVRGDKLLLREASPNAPRPPV
jgi:aspartyl protease family protein